MPRQVSTQWALAAGAAIAMLAVTALMPGRTAPVSAATGSELGRVVSGTGVINDSPAPGLSTTVTVDANLGYDGTLTGWFTKSIEGVSTLSGPITCAWVTGSRATLGLGEWDQGRQLVSISDNDPAADSLWVDTEGAFGGDCTAGPVDGGTLLSAGDFSVYPLPAASFDPNDSQPPPSSTPGPSGDSNGDGIADVLQPAGTAFGSFVDGTLSPGTVGSIVSSSGLSLLITDAPNPDGVSITVGTQVPGAEAELSLCGFTVLLAPGTVTVATCGSVILDVLRGNASIVLGDGLTVVGIPAGATAEVRDDGTGTFVVENLGIAGSPDISITVDGALATLSAGEVVTARVWSFSGFGAPVDPIPTLNRMKAGQAVPLRWRLLDSTGAPVLDLTSASITSTSLDCSTNVTIDQIEEAVLGDSRLLNLGDGRYQLNWKSSTGYAGTCRTLHLNLGDGVTHDARFRFTK